MNNKIMKRILRPAVSLLVSFAIFGGSVVSAAESASVVPETSEESGYDGMELETTGGGLAGALIEHVVNIAIEDGFAAAGMAFTGVAESAENEDLEKVMSFVSSWVLGNYTDNAIDKVAELCEEILEQISLVDQHLADYSSVIESMVADQNITNANNVRNSAWKSDVEDNYKDYNVPAAYKAYSTYMKAAVDYENDLNNPVKKTSYDMAENQFYNSLIMIYRNRMPGQDDAANETGAMTTSTINDILFQDVYNMCTALNSDKGSYAEASAKLAHQAFPFSSDEYQYVYNSIYEQVLTITNLLLLYQDLVGRQSAYIYSHYEGDELAAKEEFLRKRVNELSTVNLYFQQCFGDLIDNPIALDTGVSLTLDQYMRPEEAGMVILQNTNFVDYVTEKYWWDHEKSIRDAVGTEDNFHSLMDGGSSWKEEVMNCYVDFIRTGVNTAQGVVPYYILDGSKRNDTKMLVLDYKKNKKLMYDCHASSADFYNTVRGVFTDGENTYALDQGGAEKTKLFTLFNNNAFRSSQYSSKPSEYLRKYTEYVGDDPWYLMMPELDFKNGGSISTSYEKFTLMDPTVEIPGSSFETEVISAGDFQSNGKQKNAHFALIIPSVEDQSVRSKSKLTVSGGLTGFNSVKLLSPDGKEVDSLVAEAGQRVTVRIRTLEISDVELVLERHDDASDKTCVTSSQMLVDDVIGKIVPSAYEGTELTYDIECRVPYTDATFAMNQIDAFPRPLVDSAEETTPLLLTKGEPYTLSNNLMKNLSSIEISPTKPKNVKINKKTGVVTVLKAGTTIMTLKYDGAAQKKFHVVTDVPKKVTKTVNNLTPIRMDSMITGVVHTPIASCTSSKPDVARVEGKRIIPLKPGSTALTLKIGNKTYKSTLKVVLPKFKKGKLSLKEETEVELPLQFKNKSESAKVLSIHSTHPEVAYIEYKDGKCTVHAVSKGTTELFAHLSDGTDVGPCKVAVK